MDYLRLESCGKPIFVSDGSNFGRLLKAAFVAEQENEGDPAEIGNFKGFPLHRWVLIIFLVGHDADPVVEPMQKRAKTTHSLRLSEQPKPMSRDHRRRKAKRESQIVEHGYRPNKSGSRHILSAEPVRTVAQLSSLRVKRGAYAALNKPAPDQPTRVEAVDRLMKEEGYSYVTWDGL